jgi:hypothetical protein
MRIFSLYILTFVLFIHGSFVPGKQFVDENPVDFKYEAGEKMPNEGIKIPFELVLNHIMIKAKVNGDNDVALVLDTGMPVGGIILFKNEKSEKLNLNYSGQAYVGGVGGNPVQADIAAGAEVEIGDLQLASQRVIVMPMNQNVITSLKSDGIIGYALFGRYVLQIDFKNSLIYLWNSVDEITGDIGQQFDLELRQNYPFIKCSAEITKGREFPLDMVIDLGAGHAISIDLKSNKHFTLPGNALKCKIGTGAVGELFGHIGRVSKFSIGNYSFSDVIASFSDGPVAKGFLNCNGNLGIDILRRFSVTFDYGNSKIYLKPNTDFNEPFVFNMAGFQFHKTDSGDFLIDYIIKNSPAEESGLMVNDIITEIDGKPANFISADAFDKLIKQEFKTIKLVVRRGTETINYNIKLRKII